MVSAIAATGPTGEGLEECSMFLNCLLSEWQMVYVFELDNLFSLSKRI